MLRIERATSLPAIATGVVVASYVQADTIGSNPTFPIPTLRPKIYETKLLTCIDCDATSGFDPGRFAPRRNCSRSHAKSLRDFKLRFLFLQEKTGCLRSQMPVRVTRELSARPLMHLISDID